MARKIGWDTFKIISDWLIFKASVTVTHCNINSKSLLCFSTRLCHIRVSYQEVTRKLQRVLVHLFGGVNNLISVDGIYSDVHHGLPTRTPSDRPDYLANSQRKLNHL